MKVKDLDWIIFFSALSIGNLVNGLWMIITPTHWFYHLPGRVPDFGPLNLHFVRDIGVLFLMISIISYIGACKKKHRKNALLILQLWFVPHALVHLFDTIRGHVSMDHLYLDLPLCYFPPFLIYIAQVILNHELSKENYEAN